MNSRQRVFVTGGSGFIGGCVIHALLQRGHEVRALVHASRAIPSGCAPVEGDLGHVAGFADALSGCDVVIHSAALLHPVDDEAAADRINRQATVELARAATHHGVRSFVFLSTFAVVGIRDLPQGVRSDTPCMPELHGAYALSKRAAELELLGLGGPMRVVIVRPPLVYGAGEYRNFLELTRAIASGRFLIPGRGDNRVSFCHVQNLAQALLCLVQSPNAAGVLHVADATPVTLRQAAEVIARQLGRRLWPLPFPMPLARAVARACELAPAPLRARLPFNRSRLQTLTSNFALDCDQITRLGYRPAVAFEEGVRETVKWYRCRGLV